MRSSGNWCNVEEDPGNSEEEEESVGRKPGNETGQEVASTRMPEGIRGAQNCYQFIKGLFKH